MPLDPQGHIRPPPQEQLVVIDLPLHTTSETFESPEVALANEREELGLTEIMRENFGNEAIWIMDNEGTAVGHPSDDV